MKRPYVIIYPVNGKWEIKCMTCTYSEKLETPEEARLLAKIHANQVAASE